jgi:predicted esterase
MSEHPFAQKMAQITGTTIWFTKQTPFKFAFLCGGFPPNDIELKYFLSEKSHSITTPSCHIIGDADTIIPKERSLQMLDFFEDLPTRVIVTHTGGHGLPHDGETTSAVKKFLTTL